MKLNERILENSYTLYLGYLYVVDGKPWQNLDKEMTVGDLKARSSVKEVKSCDIAGRNLWENVL